MKNNLLHMHGEFEKRPTELGSVGMAHPVHRAYQHEVAVFMAHRAMERRERARKRHMLVVAFGVLAFGLGVLALWIGGGR